MRQGRCGILYSYLKGSFTALDDSNLKKQLKGYLENLILGIEKGHKVAGVSLQTVSESDLEKFVRVGIEGDATLLRILGYNETDIDDHPVKRVLVGTTQFAPDYILRRQQKRLAVLDLKKPEEDLDNKKWAWQVLSYCQQMDAPIGLLFNGFSLRVFINTHDKQLSKYQNLFSEEPVATAEHTNLARMTELLSKFAVESLQSNPIALAKNLAGKQAVIIHGGKRQEEIRSILKKFLASSPSVDINGILSALTTVDSLWAELDPKPTEAELVAAWNTSSQATLQPPETNGKMSINPALRAKIVEVCALKGWEVIEKAQIKGLNYRLDGNEDKGFRPVSHGPNVPTGLCVQGKNTADAKKVIEELEKLKAK